MSNNASVDKDAYFLKFFTFFKSHMEEKEPNSSVILAEAKKNPYFLTHIRRPVVMF